MREFLNVFAASCGDGNSPVQSSSPVQSENPFRYLPPPKQDHYSKFLHNEVLRKFYVCVNYNSNFLSTI
ncbi:MAG: hypothetical protein ACD_42C00404G0003 [uncultured bacterium]|nr:MAG: hypothetical protein ACD_42C00404G0003 [uncultured bacterium]